MRKFKIVVLFAELLRSRGRVWRGWGRSFYIFFKIFRYSPFVIFAVRRLFLIIKTGIVLYAGMTTGRI